MSYYPHRCKGRDCFDICKEKSKKNTAEQKASTVFLLWICFYRCLNQNFSLYNTKPIILPDGSKNPEFTLHGGNVESYDDHRVAMSLACFGLGLKDGENVIVNDAECCSVSFPGFFEVMNKINANFTEI